MPAKLKLEITQGPVKGKEFVFVEHDTFVFGRSSDCHIRMPEADTTVSRHHFLLEASPPQARVRDLGSLNGTHVNGQRIGRREKGETPEQGAQRQYPQVDLKDGDSIQVGETILQVRLHVPAYCVHCATEIPEADKAKCQWAGVHFVCDQCRPILAQKPARAAGLKPVRCGKCGKDAGGEIGAGAGGAYLCAACRAKAEADPWPALEFLLDKARGKRNGEPTPAIEGYEILRQLGVGGSGAVYQARRKTDGAIVAVKIMLARVAVSKIVRKRFLREMEFLKTLRHANVVSLLDQGSVGSAFYFIMEHCDAGSLADLITRRGGRVPLEEAKGIMVQALDGLAFAHRQGIVHRDVKPGNILLSGSKADRKVKVSDFGLAKNFDRAGLSGLTLTGGMGGTPYFMPREQLFDFKHVKPVSDVWSMAASFYSMLTGQFPRNFRKYPDPLRVIMDGEVIEIRVRDRSIPEALAKVIDRALSAIPKERYRDAGKFRDALVKVLR